MLAGEAKYGNITARNENELRENFGDKDKTHESKRKQRVQGLVPIDKGKTLNRRRETFETEGLTQKSKLVKKEGKKEEEDEKLITR